MRSKSPFFTRKWCRITHPRTCKPEFLSVHIFPLFRSKSKLFVWSTDAAYTCLISSNVKCCFYSTYLTCCFKNIVKFFISKSGNYKSSKKTVISFGVFNLWICANYFPILVTADSYRQDLIDGGYSEEYANNLFAAINVKTIAILVVLAFAFGCLGAVIGKAAVKKHFEKAGIV